MPQGAHEYVEITALIKGILNGYPGNSAIFREYLQNSDDAKASIQTFILDERIFPNITVLDKVLKTTQGPALIAANDGKLRPSDWNSLQSIHTSSKSADSTQTGKNGLGFRASYHLTDNPQILSDRQMMVLDPHRAFQHHPGGVTIDIIDEGSQYPDQLSSFASIIQEFSQPFEGTAFRLPLRTEQQAANNKIKNSSTSVEEIRQLLYEFAAKDLENVILFLKHISLIEIRHINNTGTEVLVGRATIQRLDTQLRHANVCREVTWETYNAPQHTRKWIFEYDSVGLDEARVELSQRLGYDVGQALTTEKLTPNVELAYPLEGAPISGALFTLLPLPVRTHFPVNLNAVFTLTPDRQNLKNSQEIGVPGSRERLLVEWNRLIFDSWAPSAWAMLISKLTPSHLLSSPWSAWPPEERDKESYWHNLAPNVLKEIVHRKLAVWPTVVSKKQSNLVSLEDSSVLLASPQPALALDLLLALDLNIVQPPPHIFSILGTMPGFSTKFLSPETLYKVLRDKYQKEGTPLTGDFKIYSKIIDYLVFATSPPTLKYISGLPWFRLASGTSVYLGSLSIKYIIPLSEDEAGLFSEHSHMLSWDCMPTKLRAQLANPENFGILNVTTLKVDQVISFLRRKCVPPNMLSRTDSIRSEDHSWLVNFWKWAIQWSSRVQFLKTANTEISDLYLLPTTERSLRKLGSKIIVFSETPQAAIDAWGFLGVHPLHTDLRAQAVSHMDSIIEVPKNKGYLPLLLRTCNTARKVDLSQDALLALQNSLYAGLPIHKKPRFRFLELSEKEREKLADLAVFMVRPQHGDMPSLRACNGHRVLIKLEADFPLPVLNNPKVVYVDMKDANTKSLVELVEPGDSNRILSHFDVLQLAVENWYIQPSDLQDRFISKIFSNFDWLPMSLLSSIKLLPFVTVNRKSEPVAPHDLIHPTSRIAGLYEDEVGRFPTERFAKIDYLLIMEKAGFVRSSLDQATVSERLGYLSTCSQDSHSFEKASAFIKILDQYWDPIYEPLVSRMRAEPWLPLKPSFLESPNKCRDNHLPHGHKPDLNHPYYYDLALNILPDIGVYSSGLRAALGWSDTIPQDVLVEQFCLTIAMPTSREKNERLTKLINHLGQLHSDAKLTDDTVTDLHAVAHGQSWIPISASSSETATVQYVILDSEPSTTVLYPPFFYVPELKCDEFLRTMGCTTRPAFGTLVSVLNECQLSSDSGLLAAVALLYEISTRHRGFTKERVQIPTIDYKFASLDAVYFRDMEIPELSVSVTGKVAANDSISRTLAEMLGMSFLSSLALGDCGDDQLSEQMSEDLVGRIRGFLREYDVRYALNEFLANADDAHANEFSVLLDTLPYTAQRVISPEFRLLNGLSSLIFFNSAQLSESDFKGLRDIGRGGKADRLETHGRHGLGALSFYYFTDVVTVLSGDSVMILDPSGTYLPRLRGQKRTAMTRKIVEFVSHYPDQLKPYENLFQFSTSRPTFEGTLFILPMKSTIPERICDPLIVHDLLKTSYRDLAQDAFFFTQLRKISARERNPSDLTTVWSLSAERSATVPLCPDYSMCEVTVAHDIGFDYPGKHSWLVTTSSHMRLPGKHDATASALKLSPGCPISVELAIDTTSQQASSLKRTSFLFSTLRLPEKTSLPFHINARFAISSNRQSVVFEDVERDPKTAYNTWIIDNVIPPLYFATLDYLFVKERAETSSAYRREPYWWIPHPSDDITKLTRAALVRSLPEAKHPLFQDICGRWAHFRNSVFSKDEPYCVTELLRALKPPGFIDSSRRIDLTDIPEAKVVNGRFLKEVLTQTSSLEAVNKLYAKKTLTIGDICTSLRYMRDEATLVGLPLLLLSSGDLIKVPGENDRPVYHSNLISHVDLFSSASFLAYGYKDDVISDLLDNPKVNVHTLNEKLVLDLTVDHLASSTNTRATDEWIKKFWRSFSTLPGPPTVAALEQRSLKIVSSSSNLLSLEECEPDHVVYDREDATREELFRSSLQKLGISVIDSRGLNNMVEAHFDQKFPSLFDNILQCLRVKDVRNFQVLTIEERNTFIGWIRKQIGEKTGRWRGQPPSRALRTFIHQLPIWEAYTRGERVLHSAGSLRVLPYDFSGLALHAYQKANVVLASASLPLVNYLKYYHHIKKNHSGFSFMSAHAIMDSIELPTRIEGPQELRTYKDFLQCMLQLATTGENLKGVNLKAPDRDGNLRPLTELYDCRIPLFASTLRYTSASSFIHATLHDLDHLQVLDLRNRVTPCTFQVCARAVERAMVGHTEDGHPNREDLFQMADVAFNEYQSTLPAQIMINEEAWKLLDDISFVRRKDTRRQGASYDVTRYLGDDMPPLLPPSRFVRQDLEPIVWTQRLLFHLEPTEGVLAVNKSLGVPRHEEVVQHLIILATKIAHDHPRDQTLISDLKATYMWLNSHFGAAREALLMASNIEMFLNVSDPSVDDWEGQWVAAQNLVLNLHYDHMHYKSVKSFLQEYEKVLQAAGCQSMKVFQREAQPAKAAESTSTSDHQNFHGLRKTFNDMRKLGELTDVVLVPYSGAFRDGPDEDGGVEADRSDSAPKHQSGDIGCEDSALENINFSASDLRAHRDFLAASIPYVRASLTGWKSASTGTIPFYGSIFGAKALLDFVYTGEFELSTETPDLEPLAKLMRDFLELLPIADEWNMPDLKEKIEYEIIHKHDMIQCLPHEYHTMLDQAKRYEANKLVEALNEFQKINPLIVRDFATD